MMEDYLNNSKIKQPLPDTHASSFSLFVKTESEWLLPHTKKKPQKETVTCLE